MANDLGGVVSKYTTRLDKILEQETKTNFLNIDSEWLGDFVGAGEVKLPTFMVDGLGDYDRATGYPAGDGKIAWTTYKLKYDRGRKFEIDEMDDEEHLKLFTANVLGEFVRTKVVPEVDALRFALLAKDAGKTDTNVTFSKPEDALEAVLAAEEYFGSIGFDTEGLILNMTAAMHTMLRKAQPWRIGEGSTPDTRFSTFDGMRINVIPNNRFYTAIDLLDGKTDEETSGGYKKASDGKTLNFLIAAPGAATAVTKHEKLRYFSPEVYQKMDAHAWDYRLFHDLLVNENKKPLIYASIAGE